MALTVLAQKAGGKGQGSSPAGPSGEGFGLGQDKAKGGRPKSFIHEYFQSDGVYNEKAHRTGVTCRFCPFRTPNSKILVLQQHILSDCPNVPRGIRQLVSDKVAQAPPPSAPVPKVEKLTPKDTKPSAKRKAHTEVFGGRAVLDAVASEQLDQKTARFLVMCGCPFSMLDSPWFRDLVGSLRPQYVLPGKSRVPALLVAEYGNVAQHIRMALEQAAGVTVIIERRKYAHERVMWHAIFITENSDVLPGPWSAIATEPTNEAFVTGFIREAVDFAGPQRVIAINTEATEELQNGRQEITSEPAYKHILDLTCMMHGFLIMMGMCMGHPWARTRLVQAQQITLYIMGSDAAKTAVEQKAAQANIPFALHAATDFLSIEACVASLLILQQAVRSALPQPSTRCDADILALVQDDELWEALSTLLSLLQAFSRVIAAFPQRTSLLADVTRYLIFIGRSLESSLASLPPDYRAGIVSAFNKRINQLDHNMMRLALFLDPRFRAGVADSLGMYSLLMEAGNLLQNRRGDQEAMMRLISQVQAYRAGKAPFDMPVGADFDLKTWWLAVDFDKAPELVTIARMLSTACATASPFERALQRAGWGARHDKLEVADGNSGMIVALRTYYEQKPPKVEEPLGAGSLLALLQTPTADGVEAPPPVLPDHLPPAEVEEGLAAIFRYAEDDAAEGREGEDLQSLLVPQPLAKRDVWDIPKLALEAVAPGSPILPAAGPRIMPEVPQEAPATWDVTAVLQQYMSP